MPVKAKRITIDEYQQLLDGAEVRMLRGTKELLAYHGSGASVGNFVALADGDGMLLIFDETTADTLEQLRMADAL